MRCGAVYLVIVRRDGLVLLKWHMKWTWKGRGGVRSRRGSEVTFGGRLSSWWREEWGEGEDPTAARLDDTTFVSDWTRRGKLNFKCQAAKPSANKTAVCNGNVHLLN